MICERVSENRGDEKLHSSLLGPPTLLLVEMNNTNAAHKAWRQSALRFFDVRGEEEEGRGKEEEEEEKVEKEKEEETRRRGKEEEAVKLQPK